MPIYEYLCDDCGFEFERAQSFHDEPLDTCLECGGTVHRVISPVGIIFKGSGWYITDSRRQISGAPTVDTKTANGTESSKADAASSKGGGDAKEPGESSASKPTKTETPKSDKKAKETSPTS